MDYIIGVDGGGTKTEAVAYDLEDCKIAVGLSGPGNPAVSFIEAETNIKEAISKCILGVETKEIDGVCRCIFLGAAGIEVGQNKKILETLIGDEFHCKVIGLHDSELTHAALLKGKDGIITIAGTGSVSFGRYKGKTDKTGGWGHVLGDEGSGYWIALQALKNITLEQDSGVVASALSGRIMTHLGVSNADEMKDFVHNAGKNEIADVATVVAELAVEGDLFASEVLNRAGVELSAMTVRLYKKLGISGSATIGISGGILRNIGIVQEQFQLCLENELESVNIKTDCISPTKGACYLYRQHQAVAKK